MLVNIIVCTLLGLGLGLLFCYESHEDESY